MQNDLTTQQEYYRAYFDAETLELLAIISSDGEIFTKFVLENVNQTTKNIKLLDLHGTVVRIIKNKIDSFRPILLKISKEFFAEALSVYEREWLLRDQYEIEALKYIGREINRLYNDFCSFDFLRHVWTDDGRLNKEEFEREFETRYLCKSYKIPGELQASELRLEDFINIMA